jgi:hypothetical protein
VQTSEVSAALVPLKAMSEVLCGDIFEKSLALVEASL